MAYSISCTTTPDPVRKKCITQITPCPQALITNTSTPDKFLHRYLPGKGVYRVPPKCYGIETVLRYSSEQQLGVTWDGVVFNRDPSLPGFSYVATITAIPDSTVPNFSSLIAVTIGNIVTSISDYAFSGCGSLETVIIGNSVESIGLQAFVNCTALTSVIIPASVATIGNYAFYNCGELTTVTILASVNRIPNGTFLNCTLLTTITIPDSVTTIGNDAFTGCSALTTVYIPFPNGLGLASPSGGPVTFAGATVQTYLPH